MPRIFSQSWRSLWRWGEQWHCAHAEQQSHEQDGKSAVTTEASHALPKSAALHQTTAEDP